MIEPKNPGILDDSYRLTAIGNVVTATGSGPVLDIGAGFGPGGVGVIARLAAFVSAVSLSTGAYAVRLQESDDAATWADATPSVPVAGTGWTLAAGAYRKRYVRAAWTVTGSAPSILFDAWLDTKIGH